METAPKKRAATSVKKTAKKKSATKKTSVKKVAKTATSKKTVKKVPKKKLVKKQPLRPELPELPTSITLRNRLSLTLLSPFRFPVDSQTIAMNVARTSGLAFVIMGAVLASYSAMQISNTTPHSSTLSFIVPTTDSQLAQVNSSDATTTEPFATSSDTFVATSTENTATTSVTSEQDFSTSTSDFVENTENLNEEDYFNETEGSEFDGSPFATDTDELDLEESTTTVVEIENNASDINFITEQFILIISSIFVVILGLFLIILGLYIHRRQQKEKTPSVTNEAESVDTTSVESSGPEIISPRQQ